jgi:hypothetical protein
VFLGFMTFGRDDTGDGVGDLYVGSFDSSHVAVYNGQTGAYVRTLISAADGLAQPWGVVFGPDGNLYVSGQSSNNVLRYDFTTNTVNTFLPAGSVRRPDALAFGPDGHLYVAQHTLTPSTEKVQILRFDGVTGQPSGVFVDQPPGRVYDMEFRGGYLYAQVDATGMLQYDAATGAFDKVFVPDGSGGLRGGFGFAFGPDGDLYIANYGWPTVGHYDGATGAYVGTISGGDTTSPRPWRIDVAFGPDANGDGQPEMYVTNEGTNSVLRYAGPLTATTDTTLEVTVLDIQTKFYVPDDGASNLTYEYAIGGTTVESYALNSGNSAPRGAASNAAGDKVWVVDASKKVFVYNAAGAPLGSWTLGGLAGSAQVEDITTNGTDIWIVDAKSDKVFRYAGASSRISGSQNAASSFSLNGSNKSPKGMVTDGTSLWVVDDAGTDKVFKYTLAGTLLGSWTITAGGGSPTGITLDPSAPGHLWVVDNGTDRVYQYDNAVGRTTGIQAASASFALAAGNTNPQGIADPPPAASTVVRETTGPRNTHGGFRLGQDGRSGRQGSLPVGERLAVLDRAFTDWNGLASEAALLERRPSRR